MDCREDIDIVRCSTSKFECQFGTVIEEYFKRKCDCATNSLNSFLEVGKQLENGIFLDDFVELDKISLRQNENYAEKFNELVSFGDDKECREITSQVGELCKSVGINPCFGNKGGEYLEDVALNKINDFKCKCTELQIYNDRTNTWKTVALFDGRYEAGCENCNFQTKPKFISLCFNNLFLLSIRHPFNSRTNRIFTTKRYLPPIKRQHSRNHYFRNRDSILEMHMRRIIRCQNSNVKSKLAGLRAP